jgi:hypothetical protein
MYIVSLSLVCTLFMSLYASLAMSLVALVVNEGAKTMMLHLSLVKEPNERDSTTND